MPEIDMLVAWLASVALHTWCGWVGVTLIFSAFLVNTHGILTYEDVGYHVMNIAGALLYGSDLYMRLAWSGVSLEAVWIAIAVSGLLRIHRVRRSAAALTESTMSL